MPSQTQIGNAIGYAKFYSQSHDAGIHVYDVGLANPRSARAMQDGVRLALLHFLQQLTDFQCGRRNDLDTALDIVTEAKLIKALRNLSGKLTIVIVAHRLSAVAACDKLVDLSNKSAVVAETAR
jgi:hypothetical protein